MKISINFKVLWDSLSEKSVSVEEDVTLKACIHSGNAGDIVYSLPTVKELGAEHYVINLCSDPGFGGRNIDLSTAKSVAPLLLAQPYIKRVTIVSSNIPLEYANEPVEGIDFILDKFRLHEPFKHHLAISHAIAFGLYINLYEKWLYVDGGKSDRDYVVVSLTPRYRSFSKEYWLEVLSGLENIIVLGIPQEFHCLSGITADFVTCNDFLEMAKMIQGARLFIGNPGLPYAIAEGLKVQRIVELHSDFQNAYPIGRSGHIPPPSVVEARDLIHRLISDSSMSALQYQNTTLLRKTDDLEAVIKDKNNHIGNLEAIIKDKNTHIGNLEAAIKEKDVYIMDLEAALKDKEAHIENLEHQREENFQNWQTHEKNLRDIIQDKQIQIENLERQREENYRDWQAREKNLEAIIEDKQTHIGNLEVAIRGKDAYIVNLKTTLKEKEATLNYIYHSYGLGSLLVCNKMIDKIFPVDSKRRLLAKTILDAIKNPKSILKRI